MAVLLYNYLVVYREKMRDEMNRLVSRELKLHGTFTWVHIIQFKFIIYLNKDIAYLKPALRISPYPCNPLTSSKSESESEGSWLESHRCNQPDLGPNLARRLLLTVGSSNMQLLKSYETVFLYVTGLKLVWGKSNQFSEKTFVMIDFMPQNRNMWREKWQFQRQLLKNFW